MSPGGFGAGNGEPLAASGVRPGGLGAGKGEPLAERTWNPGGLGAGSGDPLIPASENPGGFGAGRGEPLRTAMGSTATRLLDNCLTEPLTGSTIKTATASTNRRSEMFFFMVEPSWVQP